MGMDQKFGGPRVTGALVFDAGAKDSIVFLVAVGVTGLPSPYVLSGSTMRGGSGYTSIVVG